MNRHLSIVGLGLRVVGLALGIPSLLSALSLTIGAFILRHAPAMDHPDLDLKTYGLAGALENGARAVGKLLEFLIDATGWLIAAFAVVSLASLLIAATLFLTGRGLLHHSPWARILAALIFLAWLAVALPALAILPHALVPIDCSLIGAALYSLWVLVWRFR